MPSSPYLLDARKGTALKEHGLGTTTPQIRMVS